MATHACNRYHIGPVWGTEYQNLEYINEQFNDADSLAYWLSLGYPDRFTGDMCDMRNEQPIWNPYIVKQFEKLGWNDVGTSYYRMSPGTILPTHGDLYKKYIDIFKLHGREHTIRRAIVFLENWQSGHYLECDGEPIVNWQAGDVVEWAYNTPHMAANMGITPRYTLQVTGHIYDQ